MSNNLARAEAAFDRELKIYKDIKKQYKKDESVQRLQKELIQIAKMQKKTLPDRIDALDEFYSFVDKELPVLQAMELDDFEVRLVLERRLRRSLTIDKVIYTSTLLDAIVCPRPVFIR